MWAWEQRVCSHLGKWANFSFYKYLFCTCHMPEAELCTGRYRDAFLGALVSGGSWDSALRQSLGVIVKVSRVSSALVLMEWVTRCGFRQRK